MDSKQKELENKLLLSFRLFLHDKVEAEKTLISKINRHLNGDELITDSIVAGVKKQCKQHNISFMAVMSHMKGISNDK